MRDGVSEFVLVAVLVTTAWMSTRLPGRNWRPLPLAFTATAVALLWTITGLIGFRLAKRATFLTPAAWTNEIIWPQVLTGVAAGVVAAFLWRRGLHDLRRGVHVPEVLPPERRR